MFTFGREHEKNCAVSCFKKDSKDAQLAEMLVDVVHDFLEESSGEEPVRSELFRCFLEGGSGVWEKAGSWLRKLSKDYPNFEAVWQELANHSNWKVRFRAACFLDEMPTPVASRIRQQLRQDSNKKVRDMALAK